MTYPSSGTEPTRPGSGQQKRKTRSVEAGTALMLAGASWDLIAEQLGYLDAAHAQKSVLDWLARSVTPETREMGRQVAKRRYERLLSAVWAKATTPSGADVLPAQREARANIDAIVRLEGLAAPSEMIVRTATPVEIESWVSSIIGQRSGGVIEHDPVGASIHSEIEYADQFPAIAARDIDGEPATPGYPAVRHPEVQEPAGPGAEAAPDFLDQ